MAQARHRYASPMRLFKRHETGPAADPVLADLILDTTTEMDWQASPDGSVEGRLGDAVIVLRETPIYLNQWSVRATRRRSAEVWSERTGRRVQHWSALPGDVNYPLLTMMWEGADHALVGHAMRPAAVVSQALGD
jgi:hypothetical protein